METQVSFWYVSIDCKWMYEGFRPTKQCVDDICQCVVLPSLIIHFYWCECLSFSPDTNISFTLLWETWVYIIGDYLYQFLIQGFLSFVGLFVPMYNIIRSGTSSFIQYCFSSNLDSTSERSFDPLSNPASNSLWARSPPPPPYFHACICGVTRCYFSHCFCNWNKRIVYV